jgi:pyruvate-formate lyase|tara:strand:+ start:125 stop:472 length:348 start_codon:yes stop_codon:yes gene_type:complete
LNEVEYEQRLRQRVGEGEYERHKELVRLLARNLALEDILWEEITIHIRDINLRTELLRQRNSIVRDIHTEFRALNIEIPTVLETTTEGFASFLEDLNDDNTSEERIEETTSSTDR